MQKKWPEKRWSDRESLDHDVGLYSDGQLPFSGTTRDIGIGGMYVLTCTDRVTHDSCVFVSFLASRDGTLFRHRIAARVIRIDANGAGLMFSVFSADTVRALRAIMDNGRQPACRMGVRDTHDPRDTPLS